MCCRQSASCHRPDTMIFQRRFLPAIFAIAVPMVLSNVTIPLLGLVDTAVVGHLPDSVYLAGVALGSSIITFLFWMVGFLRMSTTGSVAQALGRNNDREAIQVWRHSVLLGLFLSILLILLQQPIWQAAMALADPEPAVAAQAHSYFQIRIWGAPAALINLATLGCLLGMRRAKAPMVLLILTNLINIVFDLLFVLGLGWNVAGVAAASLLADCCGTMGGLWILARLWRERGILLFEQRTLRKSIEARSFRALLGLNLDIFLRTLALQICFTFITFQGARLGNEILAANMVLLNFLLLVSFALDGFAYAIEALAGEAIGASDRQRFDQLVTTVLLVSFAISLLFCLLFTWQGNRIIALLTDIATVRSTAARYLPWLNWLPAIAVWSYIFDGIYIGATEGRIMRNSMLLCAFGVFFPCWWLSRGWGNHALWLSLTAFMLARGLSLGWHCLRYRDTWFTEQKTTC